MVVLEGEGQQRRDESAILARGGGIPMSFPISNVVSTALFLLLISMLSGLMSLGVLKKSQPADLLR